MSSPRIKATVCLSLIMFDVPAQSCFIKVNDSEVHGSDLCGQKFDDSIPDSFTSLQADLDREGLKNNQLPRINKE